MTVRVRLNGHIRRIDKGILDVVKELNKRGFKTLFSCSSLNEDRPKQAPRDRSDATYVTVDGKRPELIDIAKAAGWEWQFSGYAYAENERPIDRVDFRGKPDGQILKVKSRALERPEEDSEGCLILWELESEIISSKEEAMQSETQTTELILDSENEKFKKQRIAYLLKVITKQYRSSANDEPT